MNATPRLLIVADDLTGALDSACEAARRGIGTRVFLSPQSLAAAMGQAFPPVVAVSTGSRDGSPEAAGLAMAEVCACLRWLAPAQVMKKVDSRLKGHVGLETAILAQAVGQGRVLAAPALPDIGRVQAFGRLTGMGIDAPIDIAAQFEGLDVELPDIGTQDEMAIAAGLQGRLAVGARSLAQALVCLLWPRAQIAVYPSLRAPAVLAIGSRDPITLAQVARLGMPAVPAPDGQIDADTITGDCGLQMFQMVPGCGAPADPVTAGRAFAEGLAAHFRDRMPATLIACGGETAGAILSDLGIGHLDVEGAALDGVPVSRATLPDGRQVSVVTKSGGFGDADALAQLADMIDNGLNDRESSGSDDYGVTA